VSNQRKRLGKGLDALLDSTSGEGVEEIPLGRIRVNPYQPRENFAPDKLEELAESIKVHGIVQPVIVRRSGEQFELVAGERRWRAAQIAGLAAVPAIVRDFSDAELMEIALVENLQREDLTPIEQAQAYSSLQREFNMTQEELARRLGVSRSQVANVLRLLQLPEEVQEMLHSGRITVGHAKVILSLEGEKKRVSVARKVAEGGLTVRQAEEIAASGTGEMGARRVPGRRVRRADRNPFFAEFEERLRRELGTRASVRGRPSRGRIEIEYYSEEDLERIMEVICGAGSS